MRFLADENVEAPVIEAMRAAGHDVACIGEIAPGVEDEQVLRLANAQSRLLLTNDKDFGELVYREGRALRGSLLMRLASEDGREKAEHVTRILPSIEQRLLGSFTVVAEAGVRVRPLRRL